MSSTAVITVTGLKEVQAFIRDAPKLLVVNGFLKALSAAANVFADEVSRTCPVKAKDTGGMIDKGVLKESVMVAVQLDSRYRGGLADVGWGAGIPINLPLWVEYGHRMVIKGGFYIDNRGRRRKGTHIADVPAYPFVVPAFEIKVNDAIAAFAEVLDETVRTL